MNRTASGLKRDAITFWSNVVIGVASTAPAYSLAAALGAIIATIGFGVPAIMIVAFVPMLFIAVAYFHLNRADPDCGTTFSWATRALGPYGGWMGGWAIVATDILVMPGLAQIAGQYSFRLVGIGEPGLLAVTLVGVAWIAVMTAICYIGIELSAHTQKLLLASEILILAIFAVVALTKAYGTDAPAAAQHVAFDWFDPFANGGLRNFTQAVLIAVFIYWGWDTGASVNEETKNPGTAPARAAIVSTILLVGIYVLVSVAAIAYAGPLQLANKSDVFDPLATDVLGGGLGKLLIFAVLTSTAASTQTTILPSARTLISMARAGAIPKKFGEIHPRLQTPGFATLATGAASIAWYVGLSMIATNTVLQDSVAATSIGIAFYYGLTGISCVVYYRRQLTKSIRNLAFIGVLPAFGALMMVALLIDACFDFGKPDPAHASLLGLGGPLVFGVGALALGVVLMIFARLTLPDFFKREREVVDPALIHRT